MTDSENRPEAAPDQTSPVTPSDVSDAPVTDGAAARSDETTVVSPGESAEGAPATDAAAARSEETTVAPPTESAASAPGIDSAAASSEESTVARSDESAEQAPAENTQDSPVADATPSIDSPPSPNSAPMAAPTPESGTLNVLEVRSLDWDRIRAAVANPISGERAERIIGRMEERLAGGGPIGLAFEEYAAGPADQAIQIRENWPVGEVWFVGDLHGDLLALEAALQHIDRSGGGGDARIVFLGDLFDDGVHAAEVVLRIFELILDGPMRVTVVTGNHDEALSFDAGRFQSSVLPSDFTDWLNARMHENHPWAERLGRLIVHFFRRTPRALFFPDGLFVAHAGIPHTDLHAGLEAAGNWNDPRILQDFVWLRAHPRARKRIPNRTTRGSEFGREDFAAFTELATRMGRPVSRMLRGHDHLEDRFAVFPAWAAHPALTINTLSHRLPREVFGPYERVPVIARWVRGELPEVRRLFIPPELIHEIYPEPGASEAPQGAV